jgi:hypothetical protein
LVIVKVPPATSSGFSCLLPRAVREVGHGAADADQVFLVRVLDHRHDQPPVERHRDADVDLLVVDDVLAVDRGIDDRHGAQRVDTALKMKER